MGQRPRRAAHADIKAQLPPIEPVATMAERTAERLRELIFQGQFRPGTPLPEVVLAEAFQVSRNTVRDAFRLLINENLLAYAMHRGVFARQLSEQDIHDIYECRRELELAALDRFDRAAEGGSPLDTSRLVQVVEEAEHVAAQHRWPEVGTENLRFHEEIVAFLGSPRRSRFFRGLMTELRLGFCAVADVRSLHEPFLPRNRQILELLGSGRTDEVRRELDRYLSEGEKQIAEAVRDAERREDQAHDRT